MGLFRQTSPEYRALVVENEREFRMDLIFTIESMDLGISVIAEASDYEDALEALESEDIDLLVTDINLTDEPQFKVGDRDGTALARIARERFDIPAIFLTAFADYDADVVTQATASDPIGFIQKHGSDVGIQTQHLIRMAMRHLELIRIEREGRQQLESIVDQLGDALIFVDADGRILDINTGACDALGYEGEELLDAAWDDVLQVETLGQNPDATLGSLIEQRVSAQLPSVSLKLRNGESALFSVQVAPSEHLREPCTLLVLRRPQSQMSDYASLSLEVGTSILIMGLRDDDLRVDFDADESRILMLELRAAVLAAVRPGDMVGHPQNTILAVLMPDTDEATAFGLSRSLVASVESQLRQKHPNLSVRGGLSHRTETLSGSVTLASAVEALDKATQASAQQVVAADSHLTVNVTDLNESTGDAAPSRLKLGFEITAGVLDVPNEHVVDMASMEAVLKTIIEPIPGLVGFCAAEIGPDQACHWHPINPFEGIDVPTQTYLREVKKALPLKVGAISGQSLPAIDFHNAEGGGFAIVPMVNHDTIGGLLALILPKSKAPYEPSNLSERKLAAIGGQHLGRLIARARNSEVSQSADRQRHSEYNIYALSRPTEEVNAAALLMELDTPIAVVGESGMARMDLLSHAAALSSSAQTRKIHVVEGRDFRQSSQLAGFIERVLAAEGGLLVVVDPQKMHLATQKALGKIIQERVMTINGKTRPLEPMRFAAITPHKPQLLVQSAQMDAGLASALGAGVLSLRPLRTTPNLILHWADAILEAEASIVGRSGLSLNASGQESATRHSWPGNLIELQSRLRTAVERGARDELSEIDLGLFQLRSVVSGSAGGQSMSHEPLEPLAYALASAIDIGRNLHTPPPVGDWLADELMEYAIDRHGSAENPLCDAASFLGINLPLAKELAARASDSSADRAAQEFWLATRTASRTWLDHTPQMDREFHEILAPLIVEPLSNCVPTLSEEQQKLIAGQVFSGYLDP